MSNNQAEQNTSTYTGHIDWQHKNDHRWQKPWQKCCNCHNDMVFSPVAIMIMQARNDTKYGSNVHSQRNYRHVSKQTHTTNKYYTFILLKFIYY